MTAKQIKEKAMHYLYLLEDKTGYQEDNLGKAINMLQNYKIKETK